MLYLTMVFGRNRATGDIKTLDLVGSLTGGVSAVEHSRLHEIIRANSAEAKKLRDTYSHVLFFVDNQLRQSYELPDPTKLLRDQEMARFGEAERALTSALYRKARAEEAAATAETAGVEVDQLQKEVDELRKSLGLSAETSLLPSSQTARDVPVVPTLEELMAATGYAERVAKRLLVSEETKRTAIEANPTIPEHELNEKVTDALRKFDEENPAPTPPQLAITADGQGVASGRVITLPTLDALMQGGLDERAARRVIAVESAKSVALQENPAMPDHDLLAAGELAGEEFDAKNPAAAPELKQPDPNEPFQKQKQAPVEGLAANLAENVDTQSNADASADATKKVRDVQGTIEDLRTLGEEEGVDLTGCRVKPELSDRLHAFFALNDNHTVPELLEIASQEQAPIASGMHKAEIVNTILAHRRSK
jgi:hypothetical protein